jgi:hypothetical protein
MLMETFKLSDTLLKTSLSTAEDIHNKHGIASLHVLHDVQPSDYENRGFDAV